MITVNVPAWAAQHVRASHYSDSESGMGRLGPIRKRQLLTRAGRVALVAPPSGIPSSLDTAAYGIPLACVHVVSNGRQRHAAADLNTAITQGPETPGAVCRGAGSWQPEA
jgi:hypothetical protein